MSKNKLGTEEAFFSGGNNLVAESGKEMYSIKDIENITGIKAHTIRIWEQRYNLMTTKRTATNIRFYDDADLRLLLNISFLNNKGYKISKIAEMDTQEIAILCNELVKESSENKDIEQMLSAMLSFDESNFVRVLSNCILKKGLEQTMSELIFPFLEKCGVMWITGRIQPAHEHFASNLIRQKLHVSIDNQQSDLTTNAKKFLLFVPSGENHDIGLLFANYMLRSRGQHVIYLGSSLPYEELSQILSTHNPDYIFSIITALSSKINIQYFVNTLSENWPNTTILLSGNQILNKRDLQVPENVRLIYSPKDFDQYLGKLN
jgi:DNA-binding transcriptional MerR regulator/methylmalonyl-CoA mutase cobalamin-binding subunit